MVDGESVLKYNLVPIIFPVHPSVNFMVRRAALGGQQNPGPDTRPGVVGLTEAKGISC